MQDMEIKPINDREMVECPSCHVASLNPKFLPPSRQKKTPVLFWEKDEVLLRNLMWDYIYLTTLICKDCGCNFSLPVRKLSEEEYQLEQKNKKSENSKANGKSNSDNGE